jgi:putative Mn2+ efflux pump MntP
MDFVTILLLALALAMDAFAVALAAGAALGRANRRQLFRLSFHFGLFQFLMPIIGWFAGVQVEHFIEAFDHWIAFALLAFIGGKMIRESIDHAAERYRSDMTKGMSLVLLSVATSIDALAVGFSLAVVNVAILLPSVIIGLVAGGMTLTGMRLGEKISGRFGRRMELVGGIVLILIGIRIVIEHLAR